MKKIYTWLGLVLILNPLITVAQVKVDYVSFHFTAAYGVSSVKEKFGSALILDFDLAFENQSMGIHMNFGIPHDGSDILPIGNFNIKHYFGPQRDGLFISLGFGLTETEEDINKDESEYIYGSLNFGLGLVYRTEKDFAYIVGVEAATMASKQIVGSSFSLYAGIMY